MGTLDYFSPRTPRTRWRWPWRWMAIAITALLLVITGLWVPLRHDEWRMDAVTGSEMRQTVWPFGITSGTRVTASPLEVRLRKSGIPWTPDWRFVQQTDRSVLGSWRGGATAAGPAIMALDSLNRFADISTDPELREFVRVMQSGSQGEQHAAIDAAALKTFDPLRPGNRQRPRN